MTQNTISISYNNELQQVAEGASLHKFLSGLNLDLEQTFAVAVNGDFVPKSQYEQKILQPGDELDLVAPIGGG